MRRTPPELSATRRLQGAFLADLAGSAVRTDPEREAAFRRPPAGTVADRWHVYAHGYLVRLTEALELEFAAIRWILGADAFAALAARYVAVFPPRSFDLAHAGDRLPRFLDFDPLTAELPFLPDLARLERAASAAFTAEDETPLDWEALRARTPDAAAALRLRLASGVALVESDWPIADLWMCRFGGDDDAVSIGVEGRPQRALVWRADSRVRVAAVSEAEAAFVSAATSGDVTLEDAAELSGWAPETAGLDALLAAFRALVERGIFVHGRSAGWTGALEIPKEEHP
jgi:putative DNA-binding protein